MPGAGQVKPGTVQLGVQTMRMTITADQYGNINVDGPIANKMLCYGMLERAKDIVRDYDALVQPADATQLPPKS